MTEYAYVIYFEDEFEYKNNCKVNKGSDRWTPEQAWREAAHIASRKGWGTPVKIVEKVTQSTELPKG